MHQVFQHEFEMPTYFSALLQLMNRGDLSNLIECYQKKVIMSMKKLPDRTTEFRRITAAYHGASSQRQILPDQLFHDPVRT